MNQKESTIFVKLTRKDKGDSEKTYLIINQNTHGQEENHYYCQQHCCDPLRLLGLLILRIPAKIIRTPGIDETGGNGQEGNGKRICPVRKAI